MVKKVIASVLVGFMVLFGLVCVGADIYLRSLVNDMNEACPVLVEDGSAELTKIDYDSYFHVTYYYTSNNTFISAMALAIAESDKEFLLGLKKDLCKNELLQEWSVDVTEVYTDKFTGKELFTVSIKSEECD